MSEWESNCNETWVGNLHRWEEIEPNPLPWWKRWILQHGMFRCAKCGAVKEMSNSAEWSG